MKSASTQLAAHVVGESTTLATCWKVSRRDGVVLGFTDHDQDVTVDGLLYQASTPLTEAIAYYPDHTVLECLTCGCRDTGLAVRTRIMHRGWCAECGPQLGRMVPFHRPKPKEEE